MKSKGKLKGSDNKEELNKKAKTYRPKSSKTNRTSKKTNNMINIKKFQLPFENINTELKDIKKIIQESENSTNKNGKILIKNTNINIAKENIILSLRKELKFQKLLNSKLLLYKENVENNSNIYKKNYEDICKYKKQLHEDLSDFIKLMENYEKLEVDYQKEKEMIIKTNENLINYKKDETVKMKTRLDKLNTDTQNQYNNIEKLRSAIREYSNQNNDYIVKFENNEAAHDERYEMLLSEFKRVENEYKYLLDLELQRRKNNLDRMNKNLYAEEEGMAVLRLSDKQVEGQFLKNIIRDIQSQIHEIELLNKRMDEDREIAKLLGKRGAEKYRERMSEKYNNEISSINSKYNNFTMNYY